VSYENLGGEVFKLFRCKVVASSRMTTEDLEISDNELLNKLHLIKDGYLSVLLSYFFIKTLKIGYLVLI
jgi:hypothetical protein